jgi:hypothetical protein
LRRKVLPENFVGRNRVSQNGSQTSNFEPGLPDFSRRNTPKLGKIYQKDHKIFKMIKIAHKNTPNGHKTYQNIPLQGLPKCIRTWIFGLKIKPSGKPRF